jgi:hypothetical protein
MSIQVNRDDWVKVVDRDCSVEMERPFETARIVNHESRTMVRTNPVSNTLSNAFLQFKSSTVRSRPLTYHHRLWHTCLDHLVLFRVALYHNIHTSNVDRQRTLDHRITLHQDAASRSCVRVIFVSPSCPRPYAQWVSMDIQTLHSNSSLQVSPWQKGTLPVNLEHYKHGGTPHVPST